MEWKEIIFLTGIFFSVHLFILFYLYVIDLMIRADLIFLYLNNLKALHYITLSIQENTVTAG